MQLFVNQTCQSNLSSKKRLIWIVIKMTSISHRSNCVFFSKARLMERRACLPTSHDCCWPSQIILFLSRWTKIDGQLKSCSFCKKTFTARSYGTLFLYQCWCLQWWWSRCCFTQWHSDLRVTSASAVRIVNINFAILSRCGFVSAFCFDFHS